MDYSIKKILLGLTFVLSALTVNAQELNCVVEVNSRQIEGSERTLFEQMEKAIFELVNIRKWTDDQFDITERIDCSIIINLTQRLGTNQFKGNIQIVASRPIYNTSYRSQIVNIKDEDFSITFNQFEPLLYNENGYSGELTTLIAYYVYMILAYDYDSFSLEGGTKYFQKAQQLVGFAQSSTELGWRSSEGEKNRYWLVDNALSARFKPLRKTYYNYHRNGFDIMDKDVNRARRQITQSLKGLKAIHQVAPSSYNMQVFFYAKMQELIKLYFEASDQEKKEIKELFILLDPGNSNNYEKIK